MFITLFFVVGIASLLAYLKCPALNPDLGFCIPISDDYSALTLTTVSSFMITAITEITIERLDPISEEIYPTLADRTAYQMVVCAKPRQLRHWAGQKRAHAPRGLHGARRAGGEGLGQVRLAPPQPRLLRPHPRRQ